MAKPKHEPAIKENETKPNGSAVPAAEDRRPPFVPRTAEGTPAEGSSISFRVDGEGKILDSTRPATITKFKESLKKSPEIARQLGLGPKGEAGEKTFTVEHGAKIWRVLGWGEMILATRLGLPFLGKVPKELAHLIPYSETVPEGAPAGMKSELVSLSVPTAEALNFYADSLPRWLVDWLKSATGPMANLIETVLMVHAAKFMLLKAAMQSPEVFKEMGVAGIRTAKPEPKIN